MNDYDYDLDNYEVAQASQQDWREVPVFDEDGDLYWLDASDVRQYGNTAY